MLMRRYHRYIAVFALLFAAWFSITGGLTQIIDLQAILRNAPGTDPSMEAMRVGINGPPNFVVINGDDYQAPPLPADLRLDKALDTAIEGARSSLGEAAPFSFVDLRVRGGRAVSEILSAGKLYTFDLRTGEAVGAPVAYKLRPLSNENAVRNVSKAVHRFRYFGEWPLVIGVIGGSLLLIMIVTGSLLYLQLYKGRMRMKRRDPFWSAGGTWRTLHRSIGIVAAAFLLVIVTTGTLIEISSVGVSINKWRNGGRPGLTADVSRPLADGELPGMLSTTLRAYHADAGNAPIRAVRLRYFAGMPQGIVISGEDEARQRNYNAATGRHAGLTEPGYPGTDLIFGWNGEQILKKIHRGDMFGLTGRWISLLSAFSLLYLAISGLAVFLELWRKRGKAGRHGLFWK
jgi:uncharacterized iron-regulated membrane protein